MSFLFFDIESAGFFESQSHICSFGYVICDENFNVLHKEDIVMNPESKFEPRLLQPDSDCPLSYSKSYFESQPNFPHFYEKIKNLLTDPECKVIGFASEHDVDFIICACENYKLPQIQFEAFDIRPMLKADFHETFGLSKWIEFFNIKTPLQAHKSCDDAEMTMLVLQKLCQHEQKSLPQVLEAYARCKKSSVIRWKAKILDKYKKLVIQKIESFYDKKCRQPISHNLEGNYLLSLDKNRDVDQVLKIVQFIYINGGVVLSHSEEGAILVKDTGRFPPQFIFEENPMNIRFQHLGDLYQKCGEKEPKFKRQRQNITEENFEKAKNLGA